MKRYVSAAAGLLLTASILTGSASSTASPMTNTVDLSAAHTMTRSPLPEVTPSIPEPYVIVETETVTITEYVGLVEGSTLCGVATAYCPCEQCCGKSDGICALGRRVRVGDIACNWLPLGSVVEIDGRQFTVADRGSAARFNTIGRIDIYFDTHDEALNWGKRDVTIKIVEVTE